MASWADIQKLASDLQRVQLSQSSKKLSEVNCVEVLQQLIVSNQIDVVFTRDGHSYVTKKHLETEIKNECIAAGGRVPLNEVAIALNIDFDHVDRTARLIVSNNNDFTLSNSELFATEYIHRLRNELRTLLEEHGSQTIATLCKHWDLSPELLQSLLIGKLNAADFQGVVDGDTIYTTAFLHTRQLVLRAVLSALTKLTPITTIQKRVDLTTKQFWMAFESLQTIGEISGNLVGSRSSPACSYRPKMYDHLVKSCILNQYRQNDFIQFSTMKTLGLDAKSDLKETISAASAKNIICLNSLYMTKELMEQCVQAVREEVKRKGISEIRLALQPLNIPLDIEDEDHIGEQIVKIEENLNFSGGFVFENTIISDALQSLDQHLDTKARREVEKMAQERNKAGGMKSTAKSMDMTEDWGDNKKNGRGGRKMTKVIKAGSKNSVPVESSASHVDEEELESWIRDSQSVPNEIISLVIERLQSDATIILRKKIQDFSSAQLMANVADSKKSLSVIGDKCRHLYDSFNTFEASCSTFSDSLGHDLRQHLLKTLGLDLALSLLAYATGNDNAHKLKEKQRDETIDALPEIIRNPLRELFSSLKLTDETALERFHESIHSLSKPSATSLMLKNIDLKGRVAIATKMSCDLRQQIESQSEPATALLLVVLYMFAQSGRPITASGKFISQLMSPLKSICSENVFNLLQSCQKGVVTCIKNKDDEIAKDLLNEDILKLKNSILRS